MLNALNIGGVQITGHGATYREGNPCRFIAEISGNHNGDFGRAVRLIGAAKAAGADFVKFQCYTPSELVTLRGDGPAPEPWGAQGWTMRALYEKAQTPLDWFPRLFQHARDFDIVPFSSVFGLESLLTLERCACPAYKIARLDNEHDGLIAAVVSRGKPVLVSGQRFGRWHENTWLLQCPPNYPTEPADVRLSWFSDDTKNGYVGLSSHCLHPDLPIAAVARGAKLIEMHMMLRDEPSELEANVSLDEYQFAEMIRRVRDVERMLA